MTKSKLRPLADRVILKPLSVEEKTKGGIVLPDTAEKEKPEQGKVIAVGPGRMLSSGKRIPMSVKKGDIVYFTKYGPNEIKVDKEEFLVAREEDILAILE